MQIPYYFDYVMLEDKQWWFAVDFLKKYGLDNEAMECVSDNNKTEYLDSQPCKGPRWVWLISEAGIEQLERAMLRRHWATLTRAALADHKAER